MYHYYYKTKHGISCIVIHDSQFLRIDSALGSKLGGSGEMLSEHLCVECGIIDTIKDKTQESTNLTTKF